MFTAQGGTVMQWRPYSEKDLGLVPFHAQVLLRFFTTGGCVGFLLMPRFSPTA